MSVIPLTLTIQYITLIITLVINSLQEIEEILFSFNLWDDWDVLDCPRKMYYGIIKDKEVFRQLLNKYYWKPTPVINANPKYNNKKCK